MKKISIIVPVYNVEAYLNRCLTSLVNQTLEDIEIIVVNDGSQDNSQNIIDDFYNKYPEKIKSYTIENSGAAEARNFGLQKATGEYIGFMDSDDYAEDTMFEELYNKANIENAEIAVCGFYRATEKKCIERGTYPYTCFNNNVFDEPKLFINNFPYLWNKIIKKDLIDNVGIKFENFRIFEDLVFIYELFLKANKIVHVEKPLYYYRVSRENSLTSIFSEKRFDIFGATDELISFFKENNSYEYFEDELLFILLKHIYVVLEKEVPVKSIKSKNKFINQAFKYLNKTFPFWKEYNYYYKRYKKNKQKYTSKLYWKSFFIINKKQRKTIKRILTKLKKAIKVLKSQNIGSKYKKYMKLPIDTKAILINSQHGNNINGNMFYILKELATSEKYKNKKIYVTCKENNKKNFKEMFNNYKFSNDIVLVENNSKKYAKVLATSKFVFNDTSFPMYYIKPEGQIYLNTWHGTPLKTLGKSVNNDFYDIANLQKNFVEADYLLYPNKYTMEHMINDYMLKNIANNKIILGGYPRNEVFFDTKRREELKKTMKLEDKQIIAYMPTWRGNVRKVDKKGHINQINDYLEYIENHLNENQIMFVNLHPFIGSKLNFENYEKILPFPSQYETYDFLNICDVLITDYSSVFFDYVITKNKVILFAYDEEEYCQERGLYLQLDKLPFVKVDNLEDLIKEINNNESVNIEQFYNDFCSYDRGDMSKVICEYIIGNKNCDLEIIDNYDNSRKNIFIYAGALCKNDKTDEFIEIINQTDTNNNYKYYLTYITKNIKNNKESLRKISEKIDYMGQLGTFNNVSKFEKVLMFLLARYKKIYLIFKKRYNKIFKTELKRIYSDIDIKAILAYGKIDVRKLYTFSKFKGKKLLYLNDIGEFNTKVNKKVYSDYDYIFVNDNETLRKVKQYCFNDANIVKIDKVEKLNEFEKYIEI